MHVVKHILQTVRPVLLHHVVSNCNLWLGFIHEYDRLLFVCIAFSSFLATINTTFDWFSFFDFSWLNFGTLINFRFFTFFFSFCLSFIRIFLKLIFFVIRVRVLRVTITILRLILFKAFFLLFDLTHFCHVSRVSCRIRLTFFQFCVRNCFHYLLGIFKVIFCTNCDWLFTGTAFLCFLDSSTRCSGLDVRSVEDSRFSSHVALTIHV